MPYFERKAKMKLYEQKLAERVALSEKLANEEVLKTNHTTCAFNVGDHIKYANEDGVVKFCDRGECVIDINGKQHFVKCSELELVKSSSLDENNATTETEKTYEVEAYNKDADTYTQFLSTKNFYEAVERAESLDKLCKADKLLDTDGEPFDWVQITVDDKPIWIGGNQNEFLSEALSELADLEDPANNNESSDEEDKESDSIEAVVTVKTDIPQAGEIGIESAIRTNAIDLLKETLSLVDKINTSIINFADVGADKSVVDVLTSVLAEQNVCVGKLYELVKVVNPQSALTEIGEKTVKI